MNPKTLHLLGILSLGLLGLFVVAGISVLMDHYLEKFTNYVLNLFRDF